MKTLAQSPYLLALTLITAAPALGQNGLSDERVSLPDGPGSIGGVGENVEVNANLGSASYRVPLRVPEGATSDMTPSLALSYGSGAGLGWAGIGWTLDSPTIERMVHKGLPRYDTDDRFAAGGSDELVYVEDEGGDRVYRARYEGAFVRYRWRASGDGSAGYWIAEYPNGRVGYFGADASGTLVPSARVENTEGGTFRYHLVEYRDTSGRRMVQTFVKEDGWPRLDEIRYGFGGQATPRFSIRFGYEDRPDITRTGTPGFLIAMTKRLDEVEISSGAQVIRRYDLSYEDDTVSGGMSRLQAVTEYGRDGGALEIEHRFAYSRALGGSCEVGCEQPYVVDMGTLPGGVNIQTGRASLIDINGDSLPDVVSSDATGNHTFHIATPSANGEPTFGGQTVTSTMGGTDLKFILGAPSVQLLDVNGDGFTDIVDQQSASVLCNFGNGDWESENCVAAPDQLPTLPDDADDPASVSDPDGMRFFDFDNDKRIDLLRTSTTDTAFVERNTGSGFETVAVDPIGARFDQERLQLSDVNGDGLQDPVELVAGGTSATLSYRLNLGFGRWSPTETAIIDGLADADLDLAELEDLDGDGLADVVLVAGNTVSYWRNRNNGSFDSRLDIVSADVSGDIPARDGSQTVLFADMNGNGTDDVVYVSSSGNVTFLELFPVRPNLIARIDNGIGWRRTVRYTTSIAERARDIGTADEWQNRIPQSMVVVKETDTYATLTGSDDGSGIHQQERYLYHDGYYDGAEKEFRGFARVEKIALADVLVDGQEPARVEMVYDVGKGDTYRKGLLLRTSVFGGEGLDEPIVETRSEYGDCPLDGIPAGLDPQIRYVCMLSETSVQQEKRPEAEWATTRTDYSYDGYGNQILVENHGVVFRGSPENPLACEACIDFGGLQSGACGASCLGDEEITETTYIEPGANTNDRWMPNLAVRALRYASDGDDPAETVTYYDGPGFLGLAEGTADRGLITRAMERVSGSLLLPVVRNDYDALGNVISTLDNNGDPSDPTAHRRDYTYDERGLRVVKVEVRGGEYDLVQEIAYESSFLEASEATSFFVVQDGEELTPRNSRRFRYDEFGRVSAIIEPGDSDAMPTAEFTYELADPVSRVVVRSRREVGGSAEVEDVICYDGLNREVQSRRTVGDGEVLVSGFNEFNARGQLVRSHLPYTASTLDCDVAPPADVRFTAFTYDAVGRPLSTTAPDDGIYSTASTSSTRYLPLIEESYDAEDNDPESPHFETPTRTLEDGLGRAVAYERLLAGGEIATYRLGYDARGNLARVDDPGGNSQLQEHDLSGRITSIVDPDTGESTFTYDAAGNITSYTDARGVTLMTEYDALNREVATYDAANPETTREETRYDYDPDCTPCRNAAGRVVGTRFPLATGAGGARLGYDPRGRTVYTASTIEGLTFESTYTFDGAGALTSITYPDGQVVELEHDAAGRPTAVTGVIDAITYDERGQLSTLGHANGVVVTDTYDDIMRLKGRKVGAAYDLSYTRDRVGNVTAATSAGSGIVRSLSASYDSWYRATGTTVGAHDEAISVGFDLLDRITSRASSEGTGAAHVGTYSYDDARPNAVRMAGTTALSYDDAGNVTTKGAMTLTWDARGRLTGVEVDGQPASTYGYDSAGQRVLKLASGGATYYPAPSFVVRDGISEVYVVVDDEKVARLRSDALATTVLADQNDDDAIDIEDATLAADGALADRYLRAAARRLLFADEDPTMHLHEGGDGSMVMATDSTGQVRGEVEFYPFGGVRETHGFVDALGFGAQELDPETDLYYHQARYYDPALGRWMSADPLFLRLSESNVERWGESTTSYAFVGNNPLNVEDPTGLLGKKKRSARYGTQKKKLTRKRLKKNLRNAASQLFGTGARLQQAKRTIRAEGGKIKVSTMKAAAVGGDRRNIARKKYDKAMNKFARAQTSIQLLSQRQKQLANRYGRDARQEAAEVSDKLAALEAQLPKLERKLDAATDKVDRLESKYSGSVFDWKLSGAARVRANIEFVPYILKATAKHLGKRDYAAPQDNPRY